jgi:GntR family transcriptional regulator
VASLKQNGIPLYVQLEEIFAERIATGEWNVGETIPNELALCEAFGVSRGPVRQALDQLVRAGRLRRKQGRGTVVLPPRQESPLSDFYSFTRLIERSRMRPGMQMLSFDIIPAEAKLRRALNLEGPAQVFKIHRLRLANEEPLIVETVYIPQTICPALTAEEVMSASLYTLLKTHYGVGLVASRQIFEPSVANDFESGILGIGRHAPVLLLENTAYARGESGHTPVVYSKAVMRGDRVRYYVEHTAPFNTEPE